MSKEQLAELYDAENVWAADDDFFLSFVNQTPGSRVLDLGCGTGRLTLALAAAGHRVTGIDPDDGALDAARRKPGAENIQWITGTSAEIPHRERFDTAVLTAHVVQHISDEAGWQQTLQDLRRALLPGGRIAFDSRNPEAKAWESWSPESTRDRYRLSDGTELESWLESRVAERGLVTITEHRILSDGSQETESTTLIFRTAQRLTEDLRAAGFSVTKIFGGWHGEDIEQGKELVVTAERSAEQA